MIRDDFCAFILTHGRPDRVHTFKTLQKAGYTGKVYIVIDDEDATADEYRARFGNMVLQFCKQTYAERLDEGDNSGKRASTIYARAAMFDLALQVGCKYFIQLDDDYVYIGSRFGRSRIVTKRECHNADKLFNVVLEFLKQSGFTTVALAQGGDYLGGPCAIRIKRKAMNSFFCSVDRYWQMTGRMNEDVTTYVTEGRRGKLFGTTTSAYVIQQPTQSESGGMTELYLDSGTYVKSFYSVMYAPSCVQIGTLGDHRSPHYRIHHKINWHHCAPKIVREEHKKSDA